MRKTFASAKHSFTNKCLTSLPLAATLACSKGLPEASGPIACTCLAELNPENRASSGSRRASIQKSEFYANSFTTYSESVT